MSRPCPLEAQLHILFMPAGAIAVKDDLFRYTEESIERLWTELWSRMPKFLDTLDRFADALRKNRDVPDDYMRKVSRNLSFWLALHSSPRTFTKTDPYRAAMQWLDVIKATLFSFPLRACAAKKATENNENEEEEDKDEENGGDEAREEKKAKGAAVDVAARLAAMQSALAEARALAEMTQSRAMPPLQPEPPLPARPTEPPESSENLQPSISTSEDGASTRIVLRDFKPTRKPASKKSANKRGGSPRPIDETFDSGSDDETPNFLF